MSCVNKLWLLKDVDIRNKHSGWNNGINVFFILSLNSRIKRFIIRLKKKKNYPQLLAAYSGTFIIKNYLRTTIITTSGTNSKDTLFFSLSIFIFSSWWKKKYLIQEMFIFSSTVNNPNVLYVKHQMFLYQDKSCKG